MSNTLLEESNTLLEESNTLLYNLRVANINTWTASSLRRALASGGLSRCVKTFIESKLLKIYGGI